MESPSSLDGSGELYDEHHRNITDMVSILTFHDQPFNADMESPNDMLVDSEEFLNDADGEKDDADVAIINPDEAMPRGDDCTFSRALPRFEGCICSLLTASQSNR